MSEPAKPAQQPPFGGASGSVTDAKIRECADWIVECHRQFKRGKPTLALGVVKCLQMSLEELAAMLGQPESPNAQRSATDGAAGAEETKQC